MPPHREHALRADLLRSEDGDRTDGTVTDNRDCLPRYGLGRDGPETGLCRAPQGRPEAREGIIGGQLQRDHEGPVGKWETRRGSTCISQRAIGTRHPIRRCDEGALGCLALHALLC